MYMETCRENIFLDTGRENGLWTQRLEEDIIFLTWTWSTNKNNGCDR